MIRYLLLSIVCIPFFCYAQDLYVAKKGFKYGYIDAKGNEVIPFIYDYAQQFDRGAARVQRGDFQGLISTKNKEIIPFLYTNIVLCENGFYEVYEDKFGYRYAGLYDSLGNIIIPTQINNITVYDNKVLANVGDYDFSEYLLFALNGENLNDKILNGSRIINSTTSENGYMGLQLESTKWIILDPDFTIIETDWIELISLSEDQFVVRDKETSKVGIINTRGEIIVPPTYTTISYLINGVYPVEIDGMWGAIDKTGKKIIDLKYKFIEVSSIPGIEVTQNELKALFSLDGKQISQFVYSEFGYRMPGQLASFVKDELHGYMDSLGNEVIKEEYVMADQFIDGYACVRLEGDGAKWGIINLKGEFVVKPTYDCTSISGDIFVVTSNGLKGAINREGKEIVPMGPNEHIYDEGDLIKVNRKGGSFAVIGKDEKMVCDQTFKDAGTYSEGVIPVNIDRKWKFIDKTCNVVSEIGNNYDWVGDMHSGRAKVVYADEEIFNFKGPHQYNGKWGYVDVKGKEAIKPIYNLVMDFSDGLAAVSQVSVEDEGYSGSVPLWGYIDTTGKIQIEPQYYYAGYFVDGLAPVLNKSHLWGYIDKKGSEVIPCKWQGAKNFGNGIAPVTETGFYSPSDNGSVECSWKFIDKTGKLVFDNSLQDVDPCVNGTIATVEGNGCGLIDSKGARILPPEYTSMYPLQDGLILASKGLSFGYLDKTGKWVIEPKYYKASMFTNGIAVVNDPFLFENIGYYDHNGKLIWPFQY